MGVPRGGVDEFDGLLVFGEGVEFGHIMIFGWEY